MVQTDALNKFQEFITIYGHTSDSFEHPEIVKFLYCMGRDVELGSNGLESEDVGRPFGENDCTILMEILWLFRWADGKEISHKQIAKYLGCSESTIAKKISKIKTSPEFEKRVNIRKTSSCLLYSCKNKDLFPKDVWDFNGYYNLSELIEGTKIEVTKDNKPVMENAEFLPFTTKIMNIIHYIKSYDGEPINNHRPQESGISTKELSRILGCTEKQIGHDLSRISSRKILGEEYIRSFKIKGDVRRYYMTPKGRATNTHELHKTANDRDLTAQKTIKSKR